MSYEPMDYMDVEVVQEKATPVQNVFFFKKDKYYRVDLQTKHIDYVNPPYPRSIGKYWLGCKEKDIRKKIRNNISIFALITKILV
ncbi:hypothetical protein R3I93_014865 [Phoxinus phoxinus]|uniref:Uncharacterized protein n=1 Tax=Phoxinus phoxinus TaxID=58324 RepID=A0AAN9H1L4_9TELE